MDGQLPCRCKPQTTNQAAKEAIALPVPLILQGPLKAKNQGKWREQKGKKQARSRLLAHFFFLSRFFLKFFHFAHNKCVKINIPISQNTIFIVFSINIALKLFIL